MMQLVPNWSPFSQTREGQRSEEKLLNRRYAPPPQPVTLHLPQTPWNDGLQTRRTSASRCCLVLSVESEIFSVGWPHRLPHTQQWDSAVRPCSGCCQSAPLYGLTFFLSPPHFIGQSSWSSPWNLSSQAKIAPKLNGVATRREGQIPVGHAYTWATKLLEHAFWDFKTGIQHRLKWIRMEINHTKSFKIMQRNW